MEHFRASPDDPNIVLLERLGEGRAGEGWRGKLSWRSHKEHVVGKIANRTSNRTLELECEAGVYQKLRGLSGVPQFYGLFCDDLVELLILEDVGRLVDDIREIPLQSRYVTSSVVGMADFEYSLKEKSVKNCQGNSQTRDLARRPKATESGLPRSYRDPLCD
jgi:hypothetical protein